jgi:hypothetical protein
VQLDYACFVVARTSCCDRSYPGAAALGPSARWWKQIHHVSKRTTNVAPPRSSCKSRWPRYVLSVATHMEDDQVQVSDKDRLVCFLSNDWMRSFATTDMHARRASNTSLPYKSCSHSLTVQLASHQSSGFAVELVASLARRNVWDQAYKKPCSCMLWPSSQASAIPHRAGLSQWSGQAAFIEIF